MVNCICRLYKCLQWKLTGSNMSNPPPNVIAQHYSSATFVSSPFHSSQGINTGGFKNYISTFLFVTLKNWVSPALFTLKLCKSKSVRNRARLVWQTAVITNWTPAHALTRTHARVIKMQRDLSSSGIDVCGGHDKPTCSFPQKTTCLFTASQTLRQKAANSHDSLLLRQHTWRRYILQATVAVLYDLCSSGVWCRSGWYAISDVAGGTLKVVTDMLFRIAGNQLPIYATSHPGTASASISIYCKLPLPSPYRNNFFREQWLWFESFNINRNRYKSNCIKGLAIRSMTLHISTGPVTHAVYVSNCRML